MLFNFAVQYAIRIVKVNHDDLKMKVTHQFPIYADDVNILGGWLITAEKNTEALVVASKEICLEVNAGKTKYMVMSREQNAGQSHNMTIDNSPFEKVEGFRYLGTILMNQNSIQEEIKSRLKSGNACYPSLQNLLSSGLLSKNINIKKYNFAFILYGCETWSLILREERRLLRRIFGPKRDEVTGKWRKLHKEELNYLYDLYSSLTIVRVINSRRMRWVEHVARMGRGEVYAVLVGKTEGKRPLGRPRLKWKDNINMDLHELGCGGMDWIDLAQDRDRWWHL